MTLCKYQVAVFPFTGSVFLLPKYKIFKFYFCKCIVGKYSRAGDSCLARALGTGQAMINIQLMLHVVR